VDSWNRQNDFINGQTSIRSQVLNIAGYFAFF
jgi:hypothetical protein